MENKTTSEILSRTTAFCQIAAIVKFICTQSWEVDEKKQGKWAVYP